MDEMEKIARQAQDYYQSAPVIILGSGSSAAFGISGMGMLANHLLSVIDVSGHSTDEKNSWEVFSSLLKNGVNLEEALHKTQLSPEISEKVVRSTWELIAPEDLRVFNASLEGRNYFPLGCLLKNIFRSTAKNIDVITTNYDRLAEYACEQEGIHHYTGFSHGFKRHPMPPNHIRAPRQVNIWKVHGSLDWFSSADGIHIGLGNAGGVPNGFKPLIVTPGIEKYRNTHREPFKTIIHHADDVLDAASAYICIGFGFNDEHIQEKLVNRCAKHDAKVIIITYKLSDSARSFILGRHAANFIAIESGGDENESFVYSSIIDDMITVKADHWSLSGFLKLII